MRRSLFIACFLGLAVVAYIFWPITGFYRLASAIDSRDPKELASAVDFARLSKSLGKQMVQTYLELSDKKREKQKAPRLTMMERSLALSAGNAIAEPIVANLVNDQTLVELLTKGRIPKSKHKETKANAGETAGEAELEPEKEAELEPEKLAPLADATSWNGWQMWLAADHRVTDVVTLVPPNKPREEQFRATFGLSGWRWKLTGLDLPQHMRVQLVKQILAEQKAGLD